MFWQFTICNFYEFIISFFLFLIFVLSSFLYFVHAQNSHLSKEKLLALKKVELNIKDLYNELNAAQYDLSFEAFRYAYIGYQSLKKQHRLNDKELFSIIDFTKDCNSKRFYTIDLEKEEVKKQKPKASWTTMQFGANDMYSNFFVTPKSEVEKTSIVKSEKTVLVASADNSTSLPMLAKLSSNKRT